MEDFALATVQIPLMFEFFFFFFTTSTYYFCEEENQ